LLQTEKQIRNALDANWNAYCIKMHHQI